LLSTRLANVKHRASDIPKLLHLQHVSRPPHNVCSLGLALSPLKPYKDYEITRAFVFPAINFARGISIQTAVYI